VTADGASLPGPSARPAESEIQQPTASNKTLKQSTRPFFTIKVPLVLINYGKGRQYRSAGPNQAWLNCYFQFASK